MRSRFLIGLTATCLSLAACQGLKDALSAHVDTVARAGSEELTVTKLSDLLGNAKIQAEVNKQNVQTVADIWSGYQQIAYAAAHGDSLNDPKSVDQALKPLFDAARVRAFMDSISKTFKVDSANEAAYDRAAAGLLAARHILISWKSSPGIPPGAAEKDSVLKVAKGIRAQVTPANFADLAKKYSNDPTAKQNAGYLGVFAPGMMVPAFSTAVAALKPGEISQPVESPFGYHIIQRSTWADAQADFIKQYNAAAQGNADSVYVSKVQADANIQVKDNAPTAVKNAVKEAAKHANDNTTLVTYKGGQVTVADFVNWLSAAPAQYAQRIPTAPDSVLKQFLKLSVATQAVLLQKADSAHIDLKPEEKKTWEGQIAQLVTMVEGTLGVDPKMLADSAKNTPEKERLAASRADAYLGRMMNGQAQLLSIPAPLKHLLDEKYPATVNQTGVDRAFDRATKIRASADSAKAAGQPKSQIPLPGMGGAPTGGAPPVTQPAQPATAQPGAKKP